MGWRTCSELAVRTARVKNVDMRILLPRLRRDTPLACRGQPLKKNETVLSVENGARGGRQVRRVVT